MLVLSRRIDESILIGDNIEVVVLEIRGNQVRLGVEAPPEIRVLRDELGEDDAVGAPNSLDARSGP